VKRKKLLEPKQQNMVAKATLLLVCIGRPGIWVLARDYEGDGEDLKRIVTSYSRTSFEDLLKSQLQACCLGLQAIELILDKP